MYLEQLYRWTAHLSPGLPGNIVDRGSASSMGSHRRQRAAKAERTPGENLSLDPSRPALVYRSYCLSRELLFSPFLFLQYTNRLGAGRRSPLIQASSSLQDLYILYYSSLLASATHKKIQECHRQESKFAAFLGSTTGTYYRYATSTTKNSFFGALQWSIAFLALSSLNQTDPSQAPPGKKSIHKPARSSFIALYCSSPQVRC